MGSASARFHRPNSGQGLNETAQSVIRSVRELSNRMDFFNGKPDNSIIDSREPGEAYCRAITGKELAVYFPERGSVEIDLAGFRQEPQIEWLSLLTSEWHAPVKLEKEIVTFKPPGSGHWVALIN